MRKEVYELVTPKGPPKNVTDIVDYIIYLALRHGASDIHLGFHNSRDENPYLLRVRIHGKLKLIGADFIRAYYREVISRFKVLSGMNTTETNTPQDGQVTLQSDFGNVVLRLATVPSQDHEDLVIRLQHEEDDNHSLDQLLMTKKMLKKIYHLIHQKSGMIILNGPAGSGKTTTIYAMLSQLASPEVKVITAEDPIEKQLPFVSHVQVSPKTSFADLCRSFMRQDADVIFIGEVRDAESAEAAVQLAQTGHLVLTTLHTRDSIGVVSRLEAFNIHPSFIANALIGSLSQRLVPLLCSGCKTEYKPHKSILEYVYGKKGPAKDQKFYKMGPGCSECTDGIAGRVPIFELFVPNDEISDLISHSANKAQILEVAQNNGMTTLSQEALIRVHAGYVDIEAVYGYLEKAAA